MLKLMTTSILFTLLVACGGPPADECESGDTRCEGDVVQLCNVDVEDPYSVRYIWTEFETCSENVDSGYTVCGTFDGDALCEVPTES